MSTDLELLQSARTALLTAIAANAGKPNYSIDGQSVSWDTAYKQLAELNQQISALGGPVEDIVEGHV